MTGWKNGCPFQPNPVADIYRGIHRHYEMMNHLFTFFLDKVWRARAASGLLTFFSEKGRADWLDACCGTGAMTIELIKRYGAGAVCCASDFSADMLHIASIKQPLKKCGVDFILCKSAQTPFADGSFNIITVSFALRNLALADDGITNHFREFHRLLKPGGVLMVLETGQPENPLLRKIFHLYVTELITRIGRVVPGSADAYGYLSSSVVSHSNADEVRTMLEEAGFSEVAMKKMTFGAVCAHYAVKMI